VDSVFRCEHGAIGGSYCCTDFVSETSSENGSDTGSLYAVNSLCNPAAHMLSDKVFGESMDSSDVSSVSRTSSVSCTVSSSDAQLFEIPFEDLPVLTKSFSGAGTQHRPDSHTCTASTDPAVSGIFEIHGVPISTDSESPVASVSGVLEANVYSLPNMKQSDKETQTKHHSTQNNKQSPPSLHESNSMVDNIYGALLALILKRKCNSVTRMAYQQEQLGRSIHYPLSYENKMVDMTQHTKYAGNAVGIDLPGVHIPQRIPDIHSHVLHSVLEHSVLEHAPCVLDEMDTPNTCIDHLLPLKSSPDANVYYSQPDRPGCSIADQNTHKRTRSRQKNAILFMCIAKFEKLQHKQPHGGGWG